jgi:MFS family permease
MILPLALAQFIASYAATNMNVAISAIASDLGTTVAGVQTAITLFTLTMAALMIPGSKLTDILGPQAVLRAGPDRLRDRGPARGVVAGTAAADRRVLAALRGSGRR